jgi:hypothetical protein
MGNKSRNDMVREFGKEHRTFSYIIAVPILGGAIGLLFSLGAMLWANDTIFWFKVTLTDGVIFSIACVINQAVINTFEAGKNNTKE